MSAPKKALCVLRRIVDWFPLTWLGLLVALGAGAALEWLAFPELDLVWLVIGFTALGMVAAALVSVLVGAIALKVALRRASPQDLEPTQMVTQRVNPTGFTAPTFWFLPLVQVDWTWDEPSRSEVSIDKVRLRLREKVRLLDRGRVSSVRRRIVVQDAFGLARLAVRQRSALRLTVLPHAGKLGHTPMLVSLSGGDERPHPMGLDDGDRVELRRYVPGDPARFIHWKVFGRTRKLMVRVPERALAPSRRTLAYLVAGVDDDATAAAARIAVESGVFGADWSFSADGASGPTSRVDEAVQMIVDSIGAREAGGRGLSSFLQRAERAGPAAAVVFVPPRPGPWLDLVLHAVRSRAARTRVVVTTDGVDAAAPLPLWRRLVTLPRPRSGTPSAQLDAVIHAFAMARVEVIVLDRASGLRLGPRRRAAMKRRERASDSGEGSRAA